VVFFYKNVTICGMENSQKTLENSLKFDIFALGIISELQDEIVTNQSKIEKQSQAIHELEKQVSWFKQQFKLSSQRQFGKSSETSSSINLTLFDEKMTTDQSNDVEEPTQSETIIYDRKKKKSTGRHFDVSKFPKEEKIHDLEESEKTCACGSTLEKMGCDSSIQVDHIPETFKVIEHVTLKYCCRQCETIKSAKKPETAIPKCMATAGFVAEVITKKYEQHLPLYRQSKIFERLGADIPDNTQGNWVMRAAEVLTPLEQAAREQIPSIKVLQSDDTKVKTLKPNKEGYFWGYHGCDPGNRFIFFEYSPSHGAKVPNETLKDFTGILQTDGYSGYNDLRAKPSVINVGCWDHARRKFTDVVKVADKNKNGKAAQLLIPINRLYEIEREAKEMSFAERKSHREEHAKPVLDFIHEEILKSDAPPKSLLGVAITYAKNQWPSLIKYIEYGKVPISNCWMENQVRPFALGRRNWLFTGTAESANKAALLYSLIQTCRMNGIDPRKYLEHVLNLSNAMRRGDVSPTSLLPQFIDKSIF
jgi:transposase